MKLDKALEDTTESSSALARGSGGEGGQDDLMGLHHLSVVLIVLESAQNPSIEPVSFMHFPQLSYQQICFSLSRQRLFV